MNGTQPRMNERYHYYFYSGRKVATDNNGRPVQKMVCPLREAEYSAIELAESLRKDIRLYWVNPRTNELTGFAEYKADGTRRRFGTTFNERYVKCTRSWTKIKEK